MLVLKRKSDPRRIWRAPIRRAASCLLVAFALAAADLQTASAMTGQEIAEKVNGRYQGEAVKQDLIMILTDKSGSVQERRTVYMAKKVDGGTKSVIYFKDPAKLKGTAFLTYDFGNSPQSAQWLYLPAMQRTRRISSAERGAYFLGTDFTNEDIKNQAKLGSGDYTFDSVGEETIDGIATLLIESKPFSDAVSKELGYGRVRVAVDPKTWTVVRAEYWDTNLNPLKVTRLYDTTSIQGVLTPKRIVSENLKTGHKTEFRFENIEFNGNLDDDAFTEQGLRRGL